jgi:hypothetical protein
MSRTISCSFLGAGPRFGFDLPDYFDQVPTLSTPLLNGLGGRSFDFVPAARDHGVPSEEGRLLRIMRGKDGHTVEVYDRPEAPPLWWLRWRLSGGYLYSHLREEDGVDKAELTAASLSIAEEEDIATPLLLPEPPLKYGASSVPGYEESVTFVAPSRGDDWSVTLQWPRSLAPGIRLTSDHSYPGDQVVIRVGMDDGIELAVLSGSDRDEGMAVEALVRGSFVVQ